MNTQFMKRYQSKLPYIALIMIGSLVADYIYFNAFRPQAIIIAIVLAPLVILKADWFCFFPKEDKLNIDHTIITGSVTVLIAILGSIIEYFWHPMRLMSISVNLTSTSACLLIVCIYVFLYLIDASRYTEQY